ncbi:Helicase associated domain protein [Streptomyces sp. NPDC048430]|uniref:DEAD/DEAH box helicase n=1 Tax=Streptomyces sp. NPDC048430 TaxID=3155388 RepID=UPI00343917D5
MLKPLREHQTEAVVASVGELELPTGTPLPPTGLRTQVIMATGSGKTLVAVHTSEELNADRILVLVPSLDLLDQTARAWRDGGRPGTFIGVSSLKAQDVGFPNTTDADELVQLTRSPGRITVFATYASLGLGFLEAAHTAGLPSWNLIIVDEAHRTSGRAAKPWAVVHDNTRIPSERRLYMTATPRVWQAGEPDSDEGRHSPGELVASMLDDAGGTFGRVAYSLPLEEAIERGIIAPYQVLVVEAQDPALNTALRTAGDGSEEARGKRLAALQAATVKVTSKEKLRRVLSFHQRVAEAEAFARGFAGKADELHATDPGLYPAADNVWAEYLHGEHKPAHRRSVLAQFSAGATDAGTEATLSLISSVKVLGEGVDTRECDAVVFADVRGSMPDLVQAVGRALRMHPGQGKIATLVVPVFLGPGETPDSLLASPAYSSLAKLLTALRAHDSRIEKLTEPGRNTTRSPDPREDLVDGGDLDQDDDADTQDETPASQPAQELLRFSTPRDACQLASFLQLRVLNPERVHWRRGIQAAQRYATEHQDLRVPYNYRTPASWSPADFPLGVWLTDCRRHYNTGHLETERTAQLEKLGMVWSAFDAGFEEGLSAAAAWAAEHEVGLAAPVDATHGEYPVGRWLKNQRAAARKAAELERGRAAGLPEPEGGTAPLSDERRHALEEIDPGWCPAWGVDWQRLFRLSWNHVKSGNPLPDKAGLVVTDGEDLGKWASAQRAGFTRLTPTQQWMLTSMLNISAAPAKRSRAEMWAQNLAAAQQYREREGHLEVPRSHTEQIGDQTVRLGAWVSQQRVKAAKLPPQRAKELSALGMRWT